MSYLPPVRSRHRVCVICEGYEDYHYFKRLMDLNVWDSAYSFTPINVKSASNIPARFQNEFQNDRYEIILVFCDTDKEPYREYALVKAKINRFLGRRRAAEKVIIFANPCTMQIMLLHFGDVLLKNQGKKTNSTVIEQMTGIQNYDAHEAQIRGTVRQDYPRQLPGNEETGGRNQSSGYCLREHQHQRIPELFRGIRWSLDYRNPEGIQFKRVKNNKYWEGIFSELTDNDIYVAFNAGIRFFPRHAMEKDYLRLT